MSKKPRYDWLEKCDINLLVLGGAQPRIRMKPFITRMRPCLWQLDCLDLCVHSKPIEELRSEFTLLRSQSVDWSPQGNCSRVRDVVKQTIISHLWITRTN